MLSSVLSSKRAVQMNILIIPAFVQIRELLTTNKDLASRVDKFKIRPEKARIHHQSVGGRNR